MLDSLINDDVVAASVLGFVERLVSGLTQQFEATMAWVAGDAGAEGAGKVAIH